jgi:hypothetical protein
VAARDYVGNVLRCTRRKGGDVETFICIGYDPSSRQHTLIPTTGRLCRQHLVVLNAGGWEVQGVRVDTALLKKVKTDLETFVRTSNADPFCLPTAAAVAQKNIEALKRFIPGEDTFPQPPQADRRHPGGDPIHNMIDAMNYLSFVTKMADELSVAGKLAFIEFPFDNDECARSGEYIVLDQGTDRLFCVSTLDAGEGCMICQIKVTGEPCAKILRTYSDPAYIRSFIDKLRELAADETSDRIIRDRAENTAHQLTRVMDRAYPRQSNPLDFLAKYGTSLGMPEASPAKPAFTSGLLNSEPANPFDSLVSKKAKSAADQARALGCDERFLSDASLPL